MENTLCGKKKIFFLVLGVILTLLLAWWQYDRWQSTNGTFQNLGYAIQWPIFGAFLVVAYRKYIHYETERLQGNDEAAAVQLPQGEMSEIPEDFLAAATPHKDEADDAEDIFADHRRAQSRAQSRGQSRTHARGQSQTQPRGQSQTQPRATRPAQQPPDLA